MSFHDLATELIEHFCAYLAPSDLRAVARVCRLHQAIAYRIIYQDVHINTRTLPVVLILASNPHLARMVRTLMIVFDGCAAIRPSHCQQIATVLADMRELTSLSIVTSPSHASTILSTGPDAFFPRLTSLHISGLRDYHVAIRFLGKSPNLSSLGFGQDIPELAHALPCTYRPRAGCTRLRFDPVISRRVGSSGLGPQRLCTYLPTYPRTIVPHLSTFSGPAQLAEALVPGRPVSSVFLTSGNLSKGTIYSLTQSTVTISTLDATICCSPLPILTMLALATPGLEYMRLATPVHLLDPATSTAALNGFIPIIILIIIDYSIL